jgi:Flp pilus assembly pilin Flp
MRKIIGTLRRLSARQEGQTLTEYAMVLILITLAAVTAVRLFGLEVVNLYQQIIDSWPSA